MICEQTHLKIFKKPLGLIHRLNFARNAKFLLTLTFKKKAPQSKEGGMTTGQCLSVGKQLFVHPVIF
jgi:hypothetical protein